MPESGSHEQIQALGLQGAEQAWASLNVISNVVTTRSHEDNSDTTNQGSYIDAVCCLKNKVYLPGLTMS